MGYLISVVDEKELLNQGEESTVFMLIAKCETLADAKAYISINYPNATLWNAELKSTLIYRNEILDKVLIITISDENIPPALERPEIDTSALVDFSPVWNRG